MILILMFLPVVFGGTSCTETPDPANSICSVVTHCGHATDPNGFGSYMQPGHCDNQTNPNIATPDDTLSVTYELDGTSYTREFQIVKYKTITTSASQFDASCDRGIYTDNGVQKYLIGNPIVCQAMYAVMPVNDQGVSIAGGGGNYGGCYFIYSTFQKVRYGELVPTAPRAEQNHMHYCFASTLCDENEHVQNSVCEDCPSGRVNAAGDDPDSSDTTCEALPCAENEHVKNSACVACANGKARAAGDDPDGSDTACATLSPCVVNEHVVNYACTACPAGKHKKAGDRPSRNSDCWDDGTCGGDTCVPENSESCVDHACVCKIGFSGTTCDKDVSAAGLQNMLMNARKKAVPTPEEIQERQNVIKGFVRDLLNQKLKQGASLKSAIEDTKIQVTPQDLPKRAQQIMTQLAKPPAIAVAPPNSDVEDTCSQGADAPGCGMVDIDAETNDTVILTTDPEPGSWTVLTSGGQIVSKQIRVSEFVYEMRCWSGSTWGVSSVVNVTEGAVLYECNDNVIMIGSQAGICTSSTCENGGTCIVDGEFYVCNCTTGWTGAHCETVDTSTYCYEFPCHDYGGFKSVGPCGESCSASLCCNYATKSAFDAVCAGTTSNQEYVDSACCHRSFCT